MGVTSVAERDRRPAAGGVHWDAAVLSPAEPLHDLHPPTHPLTLWCAARQERHP